MKNVIVLEEMFDIKQWLLPFVEQLHNHSNPHVFRLIFVTV